jgi:putative FmdB family regulatory protein
MPIYEYQCSHCRYYLEVMQKITDAKLKKCPSCGRSTLQKLMSAPVFRLKGSGWYETDFKSEQEQKRNLAGAEKEPPAADKDAKDSSKDAKDSTAKDAKDGKEGATKDAKDGKDASPKDGKAGTASKPAADKSKAKRSKAPARGKISARRPAGRAGRAKPGRGRR